MRSRARTLVDTGTGEMVSVLVQVPRRRHTGGFFMAYQEGFRRLAALDLPGRTRRVLDYLLSVLDFENFIHVSQAEVARELGYHRQDVNSAVKQLVEAGVLVRGPKVGQSWTYRVDPDLGWKGRASRRDQARRDLLEGRGWNVVEGGQQ